MGLFSNNNKKLCPICGNPTPRLLATKVENMPIWSMFNSRASTETSARRATKRWICLWARWIK